MASQFGFTGSSASGRNRSYGGGNEPFGVEAGALVKHEVPGEVLDRGEPLDGVDLEEQRHGQDAPDARNAQQ